MSIKILLQRRSKNLAVDEEIKRGVRVEGEEMMDDVSEVGGFEVQRHLEGRFGDDKFVNERMESDLEGHFKILSAVM